MDKALEKQNKEPPIWGTYLGRRTRVFSEDITRSMDDFSLSLQTYLKPAASVFLSKPRDVAAIALW